MHFFCTLKNVIIHFIVILFSLSNLQILKKTHHRIIDVTIFLYLASVPCVIPIIVIQKHEQSMYCFIIYSHGVIYSILCMYLT